MDSLVAQLLGVTTQWASLMMESRHVVGLVAAVLAAVLAAQLGWHGTDRIIAWRERPDED